MHGIVTALEEDSLSERRNEEVIWTKRSLLAFVLQKRGRFEYWLCSEDPGSSEKFY
jgi:hypothetical protein